jgi:hypothetical protein
MRQGFNPMEMCKEMMGKMNESNNDKADAGMNMCEGFNPMEMLKGMMEAITTTAKMAGQANPEINALFDEWASEVEKEVLAAISQQGGKANLEEIAKALKISEDSVLYFISRLIKDKKIKVTSVEII